MKSGITIRQSLIRNLLVGVILLGGGILATTFLGSRRAVRSLSERMTRQSIDHVEMNLKQFFAPVTHGLLVMRGWLVDDLIDLENPDDLNRRLSELIEETPTVSSMMVATSDGREHLVMRTETGWMSRRTDPARWEGRSQITEWTRSSADATPELRDTGYDPRNRPWFAGAMSRWDELAPGAPVIQSIHYTEPYTFFTTKQPGMTASLVGRETDGVRYVIGLDLLLADISDYTQSLTVTGHGKVFIVTPNGEVIGLPHDALFDDDQRRRDALLKRPADIGVPLIAAGSEIYLQQSGDELSRPFRFNSDGTTWWGAGRRFEIADGRTLVIGVVVPESDLLGGIVYVRLAILVLTSLLLLIGVVRVIAMARRFSQPIEELVRQSDRISQGDLEPPDAIDSNVREVIDLESAHDRMRLGLQTLLKLERDIQLARDIQQRTFPRTLPSVPGFDLHAWNVPADETGGDTYDVIGYTVDAAGVHDRSEGSTAPVLVEGDAPADRALLLLADATGHGIGPALSATQFRSMIRMAIRAGLDLTHMARNLNEQLCDDLPADRFITAWIAELNGASGELRTFSAGQAPLLHFVAETGQCHVLHADTPPFGIIPGMEIEMAAPILLAPGDVYAVISDGIFEAANSERQQFGTPRVIELLKKMHTESSEAIVEAVREAVIVFTGGAPADDDRTMIVIRRL